MRKFFKSVLATLVALSSLLLMPVSVAHAAPDTCTWTGTTNNLWSVGTNWSGCDNGGVPEAGDSLVFPAGASNLSMNNDQGALVYNSVLVTGPGYTFGGNNIVVSSIWQFTSANNTVAANMGFTSTSSVTLAVSGAATGNVISGDIIMNLTAGADMNLSIDADINHDGAITGVTDSLQETGAATWITSSIAASTFTMTGILNIASGHFQCRNNNCFGANANPVSNSSGGALQFNAIALTIPNDITLNSSASPQFNAIAGTTTLNGTLTVSNSGSLLVQGGATVVQAGATTLNTTANILSGSGYATSGFTFSGAVSGAGGITNTNTRVTLSNNANNYTGTTTVAAGGLVSVPVVNGLGSTAGGTVVQSGGTLAFEAAVVQTIAAEPITLNGNGIDATYNGALYSAGSVLRTIQSNITLASNSTIAGDDVVHATHLSGVISGTANLTFVGGDHAFRTTGASPNTYVGTVTVNSVALELQKSPGVTSITGDLNINATVPGKNGSVNSLQDEQIVDTSVITMNQGLANASFASAFIETVGSISGSGIIQPTLVGAVIRTGANNTSTTFTGNFMGNGTVEKIGTGTFTITGANGPLLFVQFVTSDGTLAVNGNFGLGNAFAANSGGTLRGIGTLSNTTVNSGGIFNAGDTVGCINVAGALNLTAGANFDQELTGSTVCSGYDQTIVTGAANLNNASLNVIPTFTPNVGDVFTIIQAGSVVGQFAGLPDGTQVTISGLIFRINYTGTTVTLTYLGGTLIPTPGGSTLASTGQDANRAAAIAFGVLTLAIGGLALEYISRRRKNI